MSATTTATPIDALPGQVDERRGAHLRRPGKRLSPAARKIWHEMRTELPDLKISGGRARKEEDHQ